MLGAPGDPGIRGPGPRSGISWVNDIMRVNTRCSIDRSHADRERLMRPGDRPPSISIPQILICFQLKTLFIVGTSSKIINLVSCRTLSSCKYHYCKMTLWNTWTMRLMARWINLCLQFNLKSILGFEL